MKNWNTSQIKETKKEPKMFLKKSSVVIMLSVFILSFSGCAGSPVRTQWQADAHNKAMLKLRPNMTSNEVIKLMGNPNKTEMYRGKNGETILVYLYITEANN